MPQFVVVSSTGRIRAVTNSQVTSGEGVSIELPAELETLHPHALMAGYIVEDGKFVKLRAGKPAHETRVALVGNWKMRCGISTYSEKLWPHVVPHLGDWKIFAERNEHPTGPLNVVGGVEVDPSRVVECWERGKPLGDLVTALREWKPDVVWIQHEYGIWPNARHWLALLSQLSGVRVIVTLHSVFKHMDKLVNEAAIPEIVVHLDGAREVLEDQKQVPGIVHVIPHGCDPCLDQTRLWNIYRSSETFMQFGFGFRYKGWENSIKAVAILKEKHPDVFFTGLFSESPFCAAEHEAYHSDLMKLVEDLGVQDNVAIIRGFQSEPALDSYMRTNRAVVFPYVAHANHEVYGASGAARSAMSKAVPVVTTGVNHFSDIPTLKADTPEGIAAELERIFKDWKAWRAQVQKQLAYVEVNSWDNVAMRFLAVLEDPNRRP